ncbi:hypothetical protein PRtIB026_A19470 [Pseudomonas sp. RtIB026]|nr:hypothetical protein PRtIB026_A19470 [Pseudomonas sp. RtIB026]
MGASRREPGAAPATVDESTVTQGHWISKSGKARGQGLRPLMSPETGLSLPNGITEGDARCDVAVAMPPARSSSACLLSVAAAATACGDP